MVSGHFILMSYWRTVFSWLVKYLKNNNVRSMAYIMNAAKQHVIQNPKFVFNDAEEYRHEGFEVDIIDLDEVSELEDRLSRYDVIYVRGGNTFDLLKSVKDSGFDKILPKILNKGAIYVSSSAGSILPGPSIEIAANDFSPDYNNSNLKDLSGIGIVDFAVFPHWQEEWRPKLDKLISERFIKYPVMTLKDNQVIILKDGRERLINL